MHRKAYFTFGFILIILGFGALTGTQSEKWLGALDLVGGFICIFLSAMPKEFQKTDFAILLTLWVFGCFCTAVLSSTLQEVTLWLHYFLGIAFGFFNLSLSYEDAKTRSIQKSVPTRDENLSKAA